MPVDVTGERLFAAVDDLDGSRRVQRQQRSVDLHRDILAPAEGASDAGKVHTHPLLGQPEARSDLRTVDVQPLGCDVDVDTALAVGNGETGFGPEKRLVLDPGLVDAGDRHVALDVGIAVADHDVTHDIRAVVVTMAVAAVSAVGMELRALGRPLHVGNGLERLVVDLDLLGRPARLLRVLGRDEGDRLAEVAHTVDREHRLVVELEAVALLARNVLVREHGVDAGHRHRLCDVDREDARMRVGAADGVAPQHPGRDEVARKRELALHLRHPVGPEHDIADAPDLERPRRRRRRHALRVRPRPGWGAPPTTR